MKIFKLAFFSVMVTLLILIGSQARVDAAPYMELSLIPFSNPSAEVDIFSSTGSLSYIGAVGANYTINITGGVTYPVIGSTVSPDLDLVSFNANSGVNDTLIIILSVLDFTAPVGSSSLNMTTGGTLDGNVSSLDFLAFYDPTNVFYQSNFGATAVSIGALGPFSHSGSGGATGFTNTFGGTFTSTGSPFSITLASVLNSTGPANASYNSELEVTGVPEPISLILLGFGLIGVWGAKRKFKK